MAGESVFDFEWDPAKAIANLRKHRVSFEAAATVFLDGLALTVYDAASSHGEERWFTLGLDSAGRLLAVAHTFQEAAPGHVKVRIVSARRATRRERRSYEEEPGQG